jgi:hypothetical protein
MQRLTIIFLLLVAAVVAGILALNWHVFGVTAHFNMLFGALDATIGALIILLMGIITVALAIAFIIWQQLHLVDYRRQAKTLHAQRALADDAEASRFTELSVLFREEMAKQDSRFEASFAALRTEFHEAVNSLAATLGELDDRLQRRG